MLHPIEKNLHAYPSFYFCCSRSAEVQVIILLFGLDQNQPGLHLFPDSEGSYRRIGTFSLSFSLSLPGLLQSPALPRNMFFSILVPFPSSWLCLIPLPVVRGFIPTEQFGLPSDSPRACCLHTKTTAHRLPGHVLKHLKCSHYIHVKMQYPMHYQ